MDIPLEKATPAFRLTFDELTSSLSVLLPSQGYASWLSARELADPRYWQQPVELSRFVHGALTGKLIFAPALGKLLPLEIHTAPVECWKCKKETRIVINLVFAAGRSFPGCANIELDIYELEELPGGTSLLGTVLSSHVLAKHGVGPVKPRFSKTIGGKYMSNGCLHCDALQGKFFDHEVAYMSKKTFEVEAFFQADWAHDLADPSSVNRWWFDPAF